MRRFFLCMFVLFVSSTASRAYTDRCGVVYWDQTQAGYRSAVENAQQLVLLFSTARKVNDARIFCEAEKAFHDTYAGYLKAALSIAILTKQMPPAEAQAIQRAIEYGGLFETALTDLLLYQHATTPDRISAFWGNPVGQAATKVFLYEGRPNQILSAGTWQIPKGVAVPLEFHVMLSKPGSSGKFVPTPKFMADRLAAQLAVHFPNLNRPFILNEVKQALLGGLRAAADHLRTRNVMDFGFQVDKGWLDSNELYAKIDPNPNLLSVDVTHPSIVTFTQWNTNILCVHPYTPANTQGCPQGKGVMSVAGRTPGEASLYAVFQPAYRNLGLNQTHMQLPMSITVTGANEPPPQSGSSGQTCYGNDNGTPFVGTYQHDGRCAPGN